MSAKGACIIPIITMHMAIKSACSTQVYPVSLPPAAKWPGWQLCAQCITKNTSICMQNRHIDLVFMPCSSVDIAPDFFTTGQRFDPQHCPFFLLHRTSFVN